MKKPYLDNIRWVTVILVLVYHVFYMYNAEGIQGTLGKITNLEIQYYDVFQYIVYPWFMMLLFIVSGICSRISLEKKTAKEFIASRTTRLLVPSTIGLFAFQFIQGWINTSFSDAVALCVVFCITGFGQNYASEPLNRTLIYVAFAWFTSMAMLGGFAKYFNFESRYSKWMSSHSWSDII